MDTYIMCVADDHFYLVGPFADEGAAADWGRANNPEDDPRWQTVQLADPSRPVDVRTPDGPMKFRVA